MVSIITPTHNAAKFIGQTAQSIFSQSYQNWEWIIVDDASLDETLELLKQYARADNRVRVVSLSQSSQRRPAVPRNEGLRRAKGAYIAFIDSDDVWAPQKLSVQIKYMEENPKFLLTYTSYSIFSGKQDISKDMPPACFQWNGNAYPQILVRPVIPNSSVVVRREVITRVGFFAEDFDFAEDHDYWVRVSKIGPIGFCAGEGVNLLRYRIGNVSQSSGFWGPWRRALKIIFRQGPSNPIYFIFLIFFIGVSTFKRAWMYARSGPSLK